MLGRYIFAMPETEAGVNCGPKPQVRAIRALNRFPFAATAVVVLANVVAGRDMAHAPANAAAGLRR
jgi:hypothetical protein